MFNLVKDDFDESPEDIMDTINKMLDKKVQEKEDKEKKDEEK